MSSKRVRLCLKDLYHRDVVEMIERETRPFSVWSVESPEDPDFQPAFDLLWQAFGPAGEMEREDTIRDFAGRDPFTPQAGGTYTRYFLLLARDREGRVRGARDGFILVNPAYDPDLCVIYLSHIYMLPAARGTVLSYWLRIAPVELATQYLADLHARGKIRLPLPESPGKYFGMQLDLVAEMEYFTPEDRISWQRILFYGRGGFDAIDPRHFPFQQPDFREPEEIRATGNTPVPFMVLVRRIGRERAARIPIEEATAIMRMLHDNHAMYCTPEFLENSHQLVLRRLEERARRKTTVDLLPLPTGPQNLGRLKRLFRHTAYTRYYPDEPATRQYLQSGIKEQLAKNPRYVDNAIAAIAAELRERPQYVYASRDKAATWSGHAMTPEELAHDAPDVESETRTMDWPG